MNPVADTLRSAAVVLLIPGAHAKGVMARDEQGDPAGPEWSRACAWCALGAIRAASSDSVIRYQAEHALGQHLNRLTEAFNDEPFTTPIDVAAAMWATADKLESET